MLDSPSQALHVGELFTPLGKDKLLLNDIAVQEDLSRPFEMRIEALSLEPNVDFNAILGRNCAVRLQTVGKAERYFNGVLVEAGWLGDREHFYAYSMVLRPWFWLLTQTTDCRIFQNLSVVDIIRQVFEKAGFRDFEFRTHENYKPIDYCVQYRESHYAFVSRLMESFGIYYFFEHSKDKHLLVLADGKSSHSAVAALPDVRFVGMAERTRDTQEYLTVWHATRMFRTGKVTLTTYDFAKPTANMAHDTTAPGGYAHDALENYDYAYKYKQGEEADLGDTFAKSKLLAMQAQDHRRTAIGDAPSLYPGGLTKLQKHPSASENIDYLVVSATHHYMAQSYRSGGADADGDSYSGSYIFQPVDRPFKAPQVTPSPIISGPQTALVVGPAGEEIYTDEYGRIKVQFHWDRLGKKDEKSSRWVRVSQANWGGGGWGAQTIPRIGMEVVVEFIEGDPDRPLVTGTVYNGKNATSYTLPANKTRMVMRSNTHKGSGFNELSFEDERGKQNVLIHAEKDKTVRVKNNHTERVDAHQVSSIGQNQSLEVGSNQKTEVGGSMNVTVGGTGAGALALMGQLANLAPVTAGLLQHAGDIAGASGASAAGIAGMAGNLASSALGFLGGGGLSARNGVVAGSSPGEDQGTALAQSGAGVGSAVGNALSSLPGMLNTVVGSFNTRSVGVASTETVGVTKVTNVGQTFYTKVGKKKKIEVGDELEIVVGKSLLIMKKDGTILLKGVKIYVEADDHIQHASAMIDHN